MYGLIYNNVEDKGRKLRRVAGTTLIWKKKRLLLDILLSVVRCCVTNCHSTECLAPCGAVAAFLQCALYMLLVLRPCTFSCRFCLVLLLVHGDFRVDFHVCSHCTVSYRFWLTLRTLCTWTRTRVLRSTLTLSLVLRLMMLFSLLCSFSLCHGLFYFLIVCHTMFCSVRHTRVAMSAICILDWCICFLLVFFTFVVVVEVIEEDVKDFILNFSVLIGNS